MPSPLAMCPCQPASSATGALLTSSRPGRAYIWAGRRGDKRADGSAWSALQTRRIRSPQWPDLVAEVAVPPLRQYWQSRSCTHQQPLLESARDQRRHPCCRAGRKAGSCFEPSRHINTPSDSAVCSRRAARTVQADMSLCCHEEVGCCWVV